MQYVKIKRGALKVDLCPSCFFEKFPKEYEKLYKSILARKRT
jgi:uncharacterized protein (DUF2225 family)